MTRSILPSRKEGQSTALIELAFGILIFLSWFICVGSGGCTVPPEDVKRVLTAEGYTDIVPGEYEFFRCADSFNARFSAVGANGQEVEGTVCGGWFTDYTVRY